MMPAALSTQADFRAAWLKMTRPERRRAVRSLGIFAAVDLVGVPPAEIVLALRGPTDRADSIVRRALSICRAFFR